MLVLSLSACVLQCINEAASCCALGVEPAFGVGAQFE